MERNDAPDADRERNPAEESADRLVEYLEGQPEAYDIRTHNYTVDFTIGDPDLWPSPFRDEGLRVIRSSSVSFGGLLPHDGGKAVQGNPQMGSNIHLPPSTADLWDTLESEESLPEEFTLVNGTFQLGGLLPPPDGVCTPHIIIVEDAEIDSVIDALDEAFRLFESVYDGGDKVIKKQPENRNDNDD